MALATMRDDDAEAPQTGVAARHGAGTSIMAPIAPPPQPTRVRRVTLPRYQMSSAHFSSCHFSVIESPPTEVAVLEEKLIPRQSRAPASETRSSPIPLSLRALGGLLVGNLSH